MRFGTTLAVGKCMFSTLDFMNTTVIGLEMGNGLCTASKDMNVIFKQLDLTLEL